MGGGFIVSVLTVLLMVVLLGQGRKRFGRAVVALALGGLASLLVGTAAWDAISHLQTLDTDTFIDLPLWEQPVVVVAGIVLSVGFYLNVAAAVLGLSKAAWMGHWGWFVAMLLALVVAFVIGYASYSYELDILALFKPQVADGIRHCSPAHTELLRCDIGRTTTVFYLLMSVLTVITPLAPLLYGLGGPDELQATKPTPIPA